MNLHEYQAKDLFKQYGIPVLSGEVLTSADQVDAAVASLGGPACVVKAQVHAGGRGKAGGVRKVDTQEELTAAVNDLLGSSLITHQTGKEGLPINTLLLEPLTNIDRELYLSLLVDRASRRLTIMASAAGGMDIEEVAENTPDQIFLETIDPITGYQGFVGRKVAFALGLEGVQIRQFDALLRGLVQMFQEKDAALVEINPLIVTGEGNLLALDGKVNLDSNAMYRHKDLEAWNDESQSDALEVAAEKHELNYIRLDGDIGCMVNGAGLAMATMDLVKLHGGQPANFLDVGGGTTAARVAEAFKIILSDDAVKCVFVNIFGGIVRCDLIAEGIIQAINDVGIEVPVIVRLEGTNVDLGKKMLEESGLNIVSAAGLTDGALKAVAAAAGE